jgi:hypothetical protein
MKVGRKSVFALLLVAALWVAMPALACLHTAAQPACCRGTAMSDCCSSAMMSGSDCCQAQPEATVPPPAQARLIDPVFGPAQSSAQVQLSPVALPQGATSLAPEVSLPLGSPGAGSILRV